MSTKTKVYWAVSDYLQEGNKLAPVPAAATAASLGKQIAMKILPQQPEEQKAKKPVSMATSFFGQPPQQQGFQAKQEAWLASLGRGQR